MTAANSRPRASSTGAAIPQSAQSQPARSADIDLAAIRHNVATLAAHVAPAKTMVVVKADAYGHGALPVALAAQAAGAHIIGTAHLEEALALREAGLTGELVAWLHTPDAAFAEALAADVASAEAGDPALTARFDAFEGTILIGQAGR